MAVRTFSPDFARKSFVSSRPQVKQRLSMISQSVSGLVLFQAVAVAKFGLVMNERGRQRESRGDETLTIGADKHSDTMSLDPWG